MKEFKKNPGIFRKGGFVSLCKRLFLKIIRRWGFEKIIKRGKENFIEWDQNFCVQHFSMDADCQLGGGSQENVSIVFTRGAPKMGSF